MRGLTMLAAILVPLMLPSAAMAEAMSREQARIQAALVHLDRAIEIARHPKDPSFDPEPLVELLQAYRRVLATGLPRQDPYGPDLQEAFEDFEAALIPPALRDIYELIGRTSWDAEDLAALMLLGAYERALWGGRRMAEPPLPVRKPTGEAPSGILGWSMQNQIKRCWSLDPGARRAEDLVVEVTVNLAPDGRVIGQPRVVDMARMNRDAYFRSAVENAVRAIVTCSPFRLPVDQYASWKEIRLTFNPREMFGS